MTKKQPLSRFETLAAWAYPAHVSREMREEMNKAAKAQGKRGPQASGLLGNKERGAVSPLGGVAGRK
jgi:hypothetical protein